MTVCAFVGPTIEADRVRSELAGAQVSGPAAFGDVYRAARARPIAIALVDGYFEHVPAVWHKEILYAMSEGVHVFGASSMGALRAVELADFGMRGVGEIYEAYRAGELEDDDEVAIVHGPRDRGFIKLSEAMVNIRATLRAAADAGAICPSTAEALRNLAKAQFYGDRTYPSLLVAAESRSIDPLELQALRAWLQNGRVDQKRLDAQLLFQHIREWLKTDPAPMRVSYRFEPTDAWHQASRVARATSSDAGPVSRVSDDAVVEELMIAGIYESVREGAVARSAAIEEARRGGSRPDAVALRAAVERLRREHGLLERKDFDRWRIDQRLDAVSLPRFIEDQARVNWARPLTDLAALPHLMDQLRTIGQYGHFAALAEAKAERLQKLGSSAPSLREAGVTESALWQWYFEERLGRRVPEDLASFARNAGFDNDEAMRRAVLREFYCQDINGSSRRARGDTQESSGS